MADGVIGAPGHLVLQHVGSQLRVRQETVTIQQLKMEENIVVD